MLTPLQPFLQHRGAGNKLSESDDQGRHLAQRRMDNRGIPLGEFRTRQRLEALHRNINTAAESAQWYRSMQTNLLRCLNRELVEG